MKTRSRGHSIHIRVRSVRNQQALRNAFTLIELLVVIAIIATLAALLSAALSGTKAKAQGIQCLNNHKQLTLAWLLYSGDSSDKIPFSASVGPNGAWFSGFQDFDRNNASNWDIDKDLTKSPLWPYAGKAHGIFQCPAEQSYIKPAYGPYKDQPVRRVRSMAMSLWMGGVDSSFQWGAGLNDRTWRVYRRMSNMTGPGPSGLIVFSDVREDCNTYPNMGIDMNGYPNNPEQTQFTDDLASFYHGGATSYSFADGHSEVKHWTDARTRVPVLKNHLQQFGMIVRSPNNQDIRWLQERATRKIN